MFRWRYLDSSRNEIGSSDPFERREDAESWMGDAWSDLLERGVENVELVDADRRLYEMGLREV